MERSFFVKLRRLGAGFALAAVASCGAWAQSAGFPNRPVSIVVPFPPGGSSDSAARLVGERMAAEWGQPVVIDNRPGAGTTLAAAHVARAPADGHTLYLVAPGTHGVSSALYRNLSYDPVRSFAGVSMIAQAPFVFVVPANSPFRSMKDLIDAAQAQPGRLSYASSGNGAGPHLITERVAQSQGLKLVHVPYKGAAPATMAAVGGQVDFSLADTAAVPQVQAGRLRALAVTSGERSVLFPGVPTLAELGMSDLVYPLSVGILAPAGTEPRTLDEINRVMRIALADPEVRRKMQALGLEMKPTSRAEVDQLLALEVRRYQEIVRSVGLKLE
jgi:tripartite-type tricarboxylate transporter receptor subunit TctC